MREPSEGRMAYDTIAEELSNPRTKLADLDAGTVELARAFAEKSHQKWPPKPQTSGWTFQAIRIA